MERTITFIAEHKKREYEQLREGMEAENNLPQEPQDVDCDPETTTAE